MFRLLPLAAALLLGLPATARPLDGAEATALDQALAGYLKAIEAGDAARIVGAIPPRILAIFAAQSGMDMATLEKTLAEQTRGVMAQSVFTELSAETAGADASDEQLADGTAVTWTVVPARFDVETGGSRSRNEQPMLALREGADWYFIRIEGAAQSQMVSLAYPFLADAHFPAATVTPLD